MILKNAKIFSEDSIRKGSIKIQDGIIKSIIYDNEKRLLTQNKNRIEIDCQERLILPGIIDIHSHLRDMGQGEKETFSSGTKAAAFSGITTVFTMPNTKPPAITPEQVKNWINKAKTDIFVDVGFISGVPRDINEEDIRKIVKLGIIGFKIYPHNPLSDIDWTLSENLHKIMAVSSQYQLPIFIHAEWPLNPEEKTNLLRTYENTEMNILELHNKLKPPELELKYVKFVLDIYKAFISTSNLAISNYPMIHFCHISSKESFNLIKNEIKLNKSFKITFEVTPHHLLLSNQITLVNQIYGKVDPPLREEKHARFLFDQLKNGNISLIATDHAPHTIEEKAKKYLEAPSGFPGFETYPILLLDKLFLNKSSLSHFIKATSENVAKMFKLKSKGSIKVGFEANLIILDKVRAYKINGVNFKSKAKFTPFENMKVSLKIWKVFLRGHEINREGSPPKGRILRSYV